jgi:ubiquinone biosynthesis protein
MKYVSRFFRLMRINYVLMRYNLGELILGTGWFSPFRFMIYLNPYHYFSRHKYTRGQRVRFALQSLGPIFIKAGQVLSTRRDLLPDARPCAAFFRPLRAARD